VFLRVVTRCRSQGAGRGFDLCLAICVLLLAVLACDITPPPSATLVLTPTVRVAPSPTVEPDDTGWQSLGNGVELRRLLVADGTGATNRLWLARADPARVRFRVLYEPNNPRLVGEWFTDVKPLLAVNAGYFTEDYRATGLIISDGVRSGQSYVGFGGMFAVRADRVEVRWLLAKPYSPAEPLRHAAQSFPMLVHSGGQPGVMDDDGNLARRTVVGQDRRGRIVFLVSSDLFFTLKNLAAFLAASDLELDTALNLDGGTSSGMRMAGPTGPTGVDSWVKIPAVIVAEPR
jgi:hypothetical protein